MIWIIAPALFVGWLITLHDMAEGGRLTTSSEVLSFLFMAGLGVIWALALRYDKRKRGRYGSGDTTGDSGSGYWSWFSGESHHHGHDGHHNGHDGGGHDGGGYGGSDGGDSGGGHH